MILYNIISCYNAPGLFVCLFSIQIGAAARCATKRAMHPEGKPRCVLRGPACDYLLCGRRTCKVFLGWETETPFLFDIMPSPVTGRNALKLSKTAEGSPGRAPRGPACDYVYTCPVIAKIAPDILGQGTEMPFYFFGVM